MAFHRLPSDAALAETLRPGANENLGLFGNAVPSLKPVDANQSALRAETTGMQVVDLNDNETIAAARQDLKSPFGLVYVTESRRTARPVVTMRRLVADIRSGADEWQASPSQTETRVLWLLLLVAVVAFFLVVAFDG